MIAPHSQNMMSGSMALQRQQTSPVPSHQQLAVQANQAINQLAHMSAQLQRQNSGNKFISILMVRVA
jgi:hypothetical protein